VSNASGRAVLEGREHRIWHPCTQMKDHESFPLIRIERGKGIYLYDSDGNSYIDAISSWWVNLFGHANERIIGAIAEQGRALEQVIFAGFTHGPAEELAERLVQIAPEGLEHVFFVDNGSAAVEAALKMSHGYFRNAGGRRSAASSTSTTGITGKPWGRSRSAARPCTGACTAR
jgi:adenosylmethionine---8-amino-7-oxononanoate aminotransferase